MMKITPGLIHWEKWFWQRIFEDRFPNLGFAFFQPWLVYLGDNRDSMSLVEELAMSLNVNTAGHNLFQHRIPLPQQRAVCQVFLFTAQQNSKFFVTCVTDYFIRAVEVDFPLISKAFKNQLIIPEFPNFCNILRDIYEDCRVSQSLADFFKIWFDCVFRKLIPGTSPPTFPN